MMSEWMVEKPPNFETDWMMVPIPLGKRNLVVSSQVSIVPAPVTADALYM